MNGEKIDDVNKQVDEIEKLILDMAKEPTEKQIVDLNEKIKGLKTKATNCNNYIETMNKKSKEATLSQEEKKDLESKNQELKKTKKDLGKLEKILNKIMKNATEAEKESLKVMGENLEEITKVFEEMEKNSEQAIESIDIGESDFEKGVNGPLKKIGTAKDVYTAGQCLGEYLKKVSGSIKEAGKIGGFFSKAFGKIFGNKGKSGFARITSLFLKGKQGVPSYLADMSLSMNKAQGSKGAATLGSQTLFDLALHHVWLKYLEACLKAFDAKKLTVGNHEEIKASNLKNALKFWTINYRGKKLETLKKDYRNWKKLLKKNIEKDLKEKGTNNSEITSVEKALLDIKDDADSDLLKGINSKVKGEIKK